MTLNAAPPSPTVTALTGVAPGGPSGPPDGDVTSSGLAGELWSPTGPTGSARFVTGEAVSLDLPVAQLGSRMLARIIDLVVQVILYMVLWAAAGVVLALLGVWDVIQPDTALLQAVAVVIMFVVLIGYPVTSETLSGGFTLGKLTFGLRVVREDGGPIRFRQAATRGLVGAAIEFPGALFPPLTWLACLWTMAVGRQGRRLGDHAAGTLVIHDRTAANWGRYPAMPPALAGWAATLDLGGLDDDLALTVRHFLNRTRSLGEPARSQLAQQLMAEVAAVTRPAPPAGVHPAVYLAAVHAERHHRAAHRLAAVRGRTALVWPELSPGPVVLLPVAPPQPRKSTVGPRSTNG